MVRDLRRLGRLLVFPLDSYLVVVLMVRPMRVSPSGWANISGFIYSLENTRPEFSYLSTLSTKLSHRLNGV
tara:strand:+ start:119 stop:331 length:213 start_codon:yes stop_codon:yes gene_type:complete